MAGKIDDPSKCDLRSVILFLQALWRSAAEILHTMRKVYGEKFMSDASAKEWCRKFKEGWIDVHDNGVQGRKSDDTVGLTPFVVQDSEPNKI